MEWKLYSSKKLVLYGSGHAGREMAYALSFGKEWELEGFVDDTKPSGKIVDSLPILGGKEWLNSYEGNLALCIVGFPKIKKGIIEQIKTNNNKIIFPIIIAPGSFVSPFTEIGEGTIIAQMFSRICPDVEIGKFVWFNYSADIGTGCKIGDFTTLYSGIQMGGESSIGEECLIGSGVTIRPGAKIGNRVIIGCGAVVIKDVPDDMVMVGNPAIPIVKR